MRFTFTEKKITVGPDIRAYAEKKVSKLDRFFKTESDAYITFSAERSRNIAEITISNNGVFYRVKEATADMHASIDSAVATIERQIRKYKTRLEKRLRYGALDSEVSDVTEDMPEEDIDIVRVKRFTLKSMSPEEAAMRMNLLDHEFFAFKNRDMADLFSVVYKRRDGGYGLIISDNQY